MTGRRRRPMPCSAAHRGLRLVLAVAAVAAVAGWGSGVAAATATTVPMRVESWYQATVTGGQEEVVCVDLECPPVGLPAHPYPEDTLHVGTAAGGDTAHTVLALDLTALMDGAAVTGGTLILPVLTDPASGSVSPESARLVACAVPGPVGEEARGGDPAARPPSDCNMASPGTYDGTADPPTFNFDLVPLLPVLADGGVVIVPSQSARTDREAFRVVFPAEEHATGSRVTATLTYDEPVAAPEAPGTTSGPPSAPPPAAPGPRGAVGVSFGSAPAVPPSADPPVEDPQVALPRPTGTTDVPLRGVPVASAESSYAYAAVWFAPLVLAGLAVALARALTAPVVLPAAGDAGRPTTRRLARWSRG